MDIRQIFKARVPPGLRREPIETSTSSVTFTTGFHPASGESRLKLLDDLLGSDELFHPASGESRLKQQRHEGQPRELQFHPASGESRLKRCDLVDADALRVVPPGL